MAITNSMALTYTDYKNSSYLRGLDGIRALSAILVISYHLEDQFLYWLDGKSGVYIFFVLSGYLITTLLLREEESNNDVSLIGFYIRRSFRIFPIYYVTFLIYALIIFGGSSESHKEKQELLVEALPYYLFYMNEIAVNTFNDFGFGHSWSLAIEEKFYLIWPVIGFVLIKRNIFLTRMMMIISLIFLLTLMEWTKNLTGLNYYYDNYSMLLIGCLLAILLGNQSSFCIIARCLQGYGTYLVIAVFITIHVMKPYSDVLSFLYPVVTAIAIAAIVVGDSRITDFLELPLLKLLGTLSYGIYLVHVLAINAVQAIIPPGSSSIAINLSIFLLSIVLSSLLAYGLHLTIERPLVRYGRRLAISASAKWQEKRNTIRRQA